MQNLTWILAAAMGLWVLVAGIYTLGTICINRSVPSCIS